MNKKLLSAIVAGVLVITSSVQVLAAPNENEKQEQFLEAKQKVDKLNAKIIEYNGKIEPLVLEIENNKLQMDEIKDEVKNTEMEIESQEEDISKQESLVGKRIRELYKSGGQTSYIAFILDAENLGDLVTKLDFSSKLIGLDKKVIKELQEEKDELDNKISELEKRNKDLSKINEKTQETLTDLNKEKEKQLVLVNEAKEVEKQLDGELYEIEINRAINHFSVIDSSTSINEIYNSINSLTNILGQVVSPSAQEKISGYIATGKAKVSRLISEIEANRGEVPTIPGESGNAIVDFAYQFVGRIPYVWGGTTPESGFDCSGLTSYVYKTVTGKDIGRTTWDQMKSGKNVDYKDLKLGDLVFTYGGTHVGIYVGAGMYVHAPYEGRNVSVSKLDSFYKGIRIE